MPSNTGGMSQGYWWQNQNDKLIPGSYETSPIDVDYAGLPPKKELPPIAPKRKASVSSKPKIIGAPPKGVAQQQQIPDVASNATSTAIDVQTKAILADNEKARQDWSNAQRAIAAGSFLVDIMNANSAYHATTGQAQMNIMMARNQVSDALYRGRQAQLDRQSEGYNAGQDALLAMAAQGQEVGGAAVQKIQGSYEAIGIFNGMQEEINSIREALGYELEIANYEYLIDQADVDRNNAIMGSALNTAITMAVV